MPDPVFIMRGPFPGVGAVPASNLQVVLDISADDLRGIGDSLVSATDFLDLKRVTEIVGGYVSDGNQRSRLSQLIIGLSEQLRRSQQSFSEFVPQLERHILKEKTLSEDQINELMQRLPLVIRETQGLDLQAKAVRLAGSLGQPLESVQLICDARPVFSADKTKVVGAIPLSTLKITCTEANGLPVSLEAVMSRKQIAELRKLCEDAETKLRTLVDLFERQEIPVPDTNLTQVDR